MGRKKLEKSMFLWMVLLMLSTNNLVIPVISITSNNNFVGNEKNYYSPADPHVPTPSSGVHSSPTHHGTSHKHESHHGSASSGGQSNCRTPPSPSGGSGGSGGYYPSPTPTPPSKGGSGGYYPSPTPNPPSKGGSGGGGSYHPPKHTPSHPPSGGGCQCPTPPSSSPPPSSGGSGGYYPPTPRTPRTPVIVTPPSTPLVPSPPPSSGGGGGGSYYPPTPSSPLVPSPPYLPDPTTPPTPFDPSSPPFPCTYWGSHPGLIFGVVGWWATVGGVFGVAALPGLNSGASLQEILTNPRNDGYGSLYREGTASFLNSMASKDFAFSTKQVKNSFLASLNSDKAAATQAKLFKLANEKKLKLATSKP